MMGVDGQSLLKIFNEWALQEYGQRDDINWLGIDEKSLKNNLKILTMNNKILSCLSHCLVKKVD